MAPSRRDALRIGGTTLLSLTPLAGCVGQSGMPETEPPTESTTSPRTTQVPPEDRAAVRLTGPTVAPELVALNSPDSITTYGDRGRQFLVLDATVESGSAPVYSAFELRTESKTYESAPDAGYQGMIWNRGQRYEYERESGWLAFDLPKPLDTEHATVRWPGGDYRLDRSVLDRLNRPPTSFEVREFSAPESVDNYQQATLTVRIANTGDRSGTFVGALNRIGPAVAYSPEVALEQRIPAGESATWTYSHTPSLDARESGEFPDMRLSLRWRGGSESVTVGITDG
ncbi:hypothetical protein [Halomarina rubra]|uniref:DUF4352 domain-containing protein n=1 Tax=Halomarina rubra TaxID=2071873 RepID=A0ABD6AZH5_9EURY|nr:hypothetical protein [Halomarina rubra]